MDRIFNLPHQKAAGLCPINGIRDLIHWRSGYDLPNELVYGLGQGGGFVYLRFNFADPPRQVYWGNATPRQHKYLANLLGAAYSEYENRSFKYSWQKAQEALTAERPPIIGPLDMFFLPFYPAIYHQQHIPIHYLLLVGCDDRDAYVLDTGLDEIQTLPLNELQQAWDVNVPGLGKRNRLTIIDVPRNIPTLNALIRKAIQDECKTMLTPPTSMIGIPAMEKVAREISNWPGELGLEAAGQCLLQVREYLNSPPDLMGNHLTAGRDIYIRFLEQSASLVGIDFSEAISNLQGTTALIPGLAGAILENDLARASGMFSKIASYEKKAFTILADYSKQIV